MILRSSVTFITSFETSCGSSSKIFAETWAFQHNRPTHLLADQSCARVVWRALHSDIGFALAQHPGHPLKMANPSLGIKTSGEIAVEQHVDTALNPYRARYASNGDAFAIDFVIKEAFGSTAPKSSAAREMKRKNTTYIVATRRSDWNAGDEPEEVGGQRGFSNRVKSILSFSLGGWESNKTISNVSGAVGLWTAGDQVHIVMIATRPTRRGRGIGELLLIATMAEAMKLNSRNVTLEVRKSNVVARGLYQKYGFSDVGIRRNYYHDNREDAIIMSTPSLTDLGYRQSLKRRCLGFFATRGRTELQVDPMLYLSLAE